jgi:DNA-directed RNA polymerase, subunit M/Transcription elongation factor TFIIS
MVKLYCEICSNLLGVDIVNDTLIFICASCQSRYEAQDDDSLRYEEVKGSDIAIFQKILEKIADDPANPKVFRDCKKCKHNIAKYVRLGEEMKLVYSCVKCKDMSM